MIEEPTTRERIAQCAVRILEAEGSQAVSVRRVAKEIGITPMAIYHYFSSREALLSEAVDAEFRKLVELFANPSAQGSFEAQMIHIMDGYIDYALTRPRIFDYVFSNPRPGARRFPEDFRAGRSPTLNPVAETVAAGIKKGELKRGDVWEIAMQLWAHAHGYLMLYRGGRFHLPETDFRKLVHRSLRRLLHGLKA